MNHLVKCDQHGNFSTLRSLRVILGVAGILLTSVSLRADVTLNANTVVTGGVSLASSPAISTNGTGVGSAANPYTYAFAPNTGTFSMGNYQLSIPNGNSFKLNLNGMTVTGTSGQTNLLSAGPTKAQSPDNARGSIFLVNGGDISIGAIDTRVTAQVDGVLTKGGSITLGNIADGAVGNIRVDWLNTTATVGYSDPGAGSVNIYSTGNVTIATSGGTAGNIDTYAGRPAGLINILHNGSFVANDVQTYNNWDSLNAGSFTCRGNASGGAPSGSFLVRNIDTRSLLTSGYSYCGAVSISGYTNVHVSGNLLTDTTSTWINVNSPGSITITNCGDIQIDGTINASEDSDTGRSYVSRWGILTMGATGKITLASLNLYKVQKAVLSATNSTYIAGDLLNFPTGTPASGLLDAATNTFICYNSAAANNAYLGGATYTLLSKGKLVPTPTLTYSTNAFREAAANDGTIDNSSPMTITLAGNTFASGGDFVALGYLAITNLPTGLTGVATRVNNTNLSVTVTGAKAEPSNLSNSVYNLTFTFLPGAFASGPVPQTLATTNLQVIFLDNFVSPPSLSNLPPSSVTTTSAVMNGYVVASNGLSTLSVLFGPTNCGTGAWPSTNTFAQGLWGTGSSPATNVSGLSQNSDYYYTYSGINEGGGTRGYASNSQYLITGPVTLSAPKATFGIAPTDTTTIVVSRPATCTGAVLTINYTTSGDATNGTHYTASPASGALQIVAGATTATITLTPLYPWNFGAARTATLALLPGAYPIGTAGSTNITLQTMSVTNVVLNSSCAATSGNLSSTPVITTNGVGSGSAANPWVYAFAPNAGTFVMGANQLTSASGNSFKLDLYHMDVTGVSGTTNFLTGGAAGSMTPDAARGSVTFVNAGNISVGAIDTRVTGGGVITKAGSITLGSIADGAVGNVRVDWLNATATGGYTDPGSGSVSIYSTGDVTIATSGGTAGNIDAYAGRPSGSINVQHNGSFTVYDITTYNNYGSAQAGSVTLCGNAAGGRPGGACQVHTINTTAQIAPTGVGLSGGIKIIGYANVHVTGDLLSDVPNSTWINAHVPGNITVTNCGNIQVDGTINASEDQDTSRTYQATRWGILTMGATGTITLASLDLYKVQKAVLSATNNTYITGDLLNFPTGTPASGLLDAATNTTIYYNPTLSSNAYLNGSTYTLKSGGRLAVAPLLTYSTNAFYEAAANDGTIDNSAPMAIGALGGLNFAPGSDFVSEGKVLVSNLPSNLVAVASRQSATNLTVTLTGAKVAPHNASNSVYNLTFTFTTNAFAGGNLPVNPSATNLQIVFQNNFALPPVVSNLPPSNITTSSAQMNGYLALTNGVATLSVLYGPTDGGMTPAWAYTNTFAPGQWPQGDSPATNVTGLTANSDYYYTYAGISQNGNSTAYATNSQHFITGPVTVQATVSTCRNAPGDTGVFTVSRPAGCTNEIVVVNVTVGGTATNGTDYTITTTNAVTLAKGQTNATITVSPVWKFDAAKTVTLTLNPGYYPLVSSTQATCALAAVIPVTSDVILNNNTTLTGMVNMASTPVIQISGASPGAGTAASPWFYSFFPYVNGTFMMGDNQLKTANGNSLKLDLDGLAVTGTSGKTNLTTATGAGTLTDSHCGSITLVNAGDISIGGISTHLSALGGVSCGAGTITLGTNGSAVGNVRVDWLDAASDIGYCNLGSGAISITSTGNVSIQTSGNVPGNVSTRGLEGSAGAVSIQHRGAFVAQDILTWYTNATLAGQGGNVTFVGSAGGVPSGAFQAHSIDTSARATGGWDINGTWSGAIRIQGYTDVHLTGDLLVYANTAGYLGAPGSHTYPLGSILITNCASIEVDGSIDASAHAFGYPINLGAYGTLALYATSTITLATLDLHKVQYAILSAGQGATISGPLLNFPTNTPASGLLDAPSGKTVYYIATVASNAYLNSANYTLKSGGQLVALVAPVITNAGAGSVTTNSATMNGTLVSTGPAATTVTLYWGPTDGGTNVAGWSNAVPFGTYSAGPLATHIATLTPDTAYWYSYSASNVAGLVWGQTSSVAFKTYSAPVVSNGGVTSTGTTYATLTGFLATTGSSPTTVWFRWGTDSNDLTYSTNVLTVGLGAFSITVTRLDAGVLYYYDCFATNSWGSMTTPAIPFRTLDWPGTIYRFR